ncbi:Inner membrane protein YbjJ [Microbacterium oxydans]|uniref:Inner membrane protein YbjJ n=1 Tax=Microbacterium oxydans TaxID=82380 RepID=A0A0F0LEY5_9MICO|nr:MFS transporter [Microbacterium oxydans]KJL30116.1 Inner membrane protein YbjJ [Microbacterium oxydans]CAH0224537.1 Inner membrane protein YbjJ [Microbacterium oxydans]
MESVLTRSQFVRWRAAIFAIFFASGLSIATWASRVPSIKADLGLDNAQVGLILLGMGIASIIGISTSPAVVARTGARRGMLVTMLLFAVGITLVGLGATLFASVPLVLVGMVLFGFGNGSLDVMMNVEATAIEQQMGKTVLPVFHAFFSFGTVIGAGVGALAAHLAATVAVHASIMGALIVVVAVVCFFQVPSREAALDPTPGEKQSWRARMHVALEAWREPRTYLIGVVMLGMSFAEGGANDWIALGTEQGHGFTSGTGAIALAVFSVGMTVVRIFGGPLVDRFGRVAVLRILAVAAASGILLFILGPSLPLVLVGAALWGIGASLGFPLGMSAAADDPAKAAARVSAAATIGYVAFLGGPPVLGFISEHIGLLNTLFILVALVVASGLFSGAARPLREDEKTVVPATRA